MADIVKDEATEYHSRKALSNSGISRFLECPAKFQYFLSGMGKPDEKQTDAQLAGTLFHAMTLEPGKENLLFGRQQYSGNTKEGRAELADMRERGLTPVKGATWDMCRAMADSVLQTPPMAFAHNQAYDFMAEMSVYWEQDGLPCKARIDGYVTNNQGGMDYIIDLKSTTDASLRGIEKSIFKYGYHRQVAWYNHAARMAGLNPQGFVFIFVEKEPPYLATCVTLSEAAIGQAMSEIRDALGRIKDCWQSGSWPGYALETITEIDLPRWMQQ